MRTLTRSLFVAISLLVISLSAKAQNSVKYDCYVQMKNYSGEKAYVVISVLDNKGAYKKTLAVMGDDKKWYPDLKQWHDKIYVKKPAAISTITGASIGGGDRSKVILDIDKSYMDAGYKLRVESSVEDQGYHATDIEIPLTTQALETKTDGKGFVRSVKFKAK